jgi:hypothetical protein
VTTKASDAPQRVLHGWVLGERPMADVSECRELLRGQHRVGDAGRVIIGRHDTGDAPLQADQRLRRHRSRFRGIATSASWLAQRSKGLAATEDWRCRGH